MQNLQENSKILLKTEEGPEKKKRHAMFMDGNAQCYLCTSPIYYLLSICKILEILM